MSSIIGVFAPLFAPAKNGGGPIRTLRALVLAAPSDFKVYVLTGDRDLGATERLTVPFNNWQAGEGASVYYTSASSPVGLMRGFRALRAVRPEVLYINGYFDPRFSILPQLLWRFGFWGRTVRLLAPRGEFGEGALNRRALKKRAYIALYRLLRLHKEVYWHASSELEAQSIRELWGDDAIILVRENEVLLPALSDKPPSIGSTQTLDVPPLHAAFLGRIVEHKGLHLALEALTQVKSAVEFDIYGPEEDVRYLERCKVLASRAPAHVSVRFRGVLEPDQTRQTLSNYDVLLMPTAGENFGHVIAEALSVSCPVICSPHTPWTPTLEAGGGAVVPLVTVEWVRAIQQRASTPAVDRLSERQRAGSAYDQWRDRPAAPHVFELLERLRTNASSRGA
ncbi:glycosyltransferase family protein [Humibacter ginsengisoli]